MSIMDMDFDRHSAALCTIVLHQILNQLHYIFGYMIAQEAQNHCDKAVSNRFLLPTDILVEFLAHYLYLWSDESSLWYTK